MKLFELNHLRNEKMIRFKEEEVNGVSYTIVSYMVASDSLWKIDKAIECRGITFNTATGECVCRPFHKFFNLHENEHTREENVRWDTLTDVTDKIDGSMLSAVLQPFGQLAWKTKNSFYSDVAIEASENASEEVTKLAKGCCEDGQTAIFEYTSPNNRVVIDYGSKPTFTLLAVRNMDTGEYASPETVRDIAAQFGVACVKSYSKTLDQLKQEMEERKDIEGYVLRFEAYGMTQLIKIKTKNYLLQHRARTDLRTRDVFDMYLNETLDDIKSVVVDAGMSLQPIQSICNVVDKFFEEVVAQTERLCRWMKIADSRKDAALKYKGDPHFGLAMKLYDGKEPDYKRFVKNNFREMFSLNTVYSNFRSDNGNET